MISNESFHAFLSEGLFQCYCRKAGPVQEIQIVYKDKTDITILETRKVFDITEIDFIGDFVEEKIINADLSKPMHIQTELCDVKGTLRIAENQEKFVKDDVEIITATIAFGMGIDKPNVRYVIHCDMPKSIEGYYQETGRAGRDGIRSDCILFFSYGDKIKHEYFIKQIENEQYQQIAYKKMWQIINFCTSKKCRRKYLLDYFGEKHDVRNCRMCDVCSPVDKVEIVSYPKGKVKVSKAKISFDYSGVDQKLFEILKALRKDIADKEKVPPYIVFSDVALKEMSMRYPRDLEGFKKINGVGDIKLKKYGSIFLEKIIFHCNTNNVKLKSYSVAQIQTKHPAAYQKWTKEEEQKLISEYNNGKTIKELSEILGRQPGGIKSRLKKICNV